MFSHDLALLAQSLQLEALEIRRHLHKYPELSWQEEKTIHYIMEKINLIQKQTLYSLEVVLKEGGIVVDLTVDPAFSRVLFRADIDALPIHEKTGLPFASTISGVMHACGHDMHTAMLLCALKACCTQSLPLKYNLRFVFQRAEEVPWKLSGGKALVHEGVCVGCVNVYGLHVSASNDPGTLLSLPGKMMSNPCHFSFMIRATGGHVCAPFEGSNAIDIATDIHLYLRNFIQNHTKPKDLVYLVPSISKSGVACNVMPGQAEVCYSLRNFLEAREKEVLLNKIKRQLEYIANNYPDGAISDFSVNEGFPILENHEQTFHATNNMLRAHGFKTELSPVLYSGEDFSYYLEQTPGCFWMLGAKQGKGYGHHTDQFNPDEIVMSQGILFWLLLATHQL